MRAEVNPDLCVAIGAAIQAGMLAGEAVSAVLVDITPYTFGTSALSERDGIPYPFTYVPIIHKNTPIPVTKSEVFFTLYDHQDAVIVHVYQGEDPDALNNIEIGQFTVENLSKAPAGNPIVLQFSLDLNGIMNVTAREKNHRAGEIHPHRQRADPVSGRRTGNRAGAGECPVRRRRNDRGRSRRTGAAADRASVAGAGAGAWWKRPNVCWIAPARTTARK